MGDRDGKQPETAAETRAAYRAFRRIQTRWADNDAYGHVNNMAYYGYFDTAVTEHLVLAGGHDYRNAGAIGLVVESMCRYFKPLAFPDRLDAGLRIGRLGRSSVRYEIALFREGEDDAAAAGHFVHVFVDRATNRPTPVPPHIRAALEPLVVEGQG